LGRSGLDSSDANFREARRSLQRLEKRVAFLTGRLEITEIIEVQYPDIP
jgi:transcription elongation GreA/GreB family factor